jgi:hypothetical protein
MIARAWNLLTAVATTLVMARDYNAAYLNSAIDLHDLERRMRDLDQRTLLRPV